MRLAAIKGVVLQKVTVQMIEGHPESSLGDSNVTLTSFFLSIPLSQESEILRSIKRRLENQPRPVPVTDGLY